MESFHDLTDFTALPLTDALEEIERVLGPHLPSRSELELYAPGDWFLTDDINHERGHAGRVLVLASTLAALRQVQNFERVLTDPLRRAAVLHDTRRNGNVEDPEHGVRAAEFAEVHLSDIIPAESLPLVSVLSTWHNIPFSDTPFEVSNLPEYTILKDADRLDRVRLRDLDLARFRTVQARRLLIEPAAVLYILSQQISDDPFVAALEAACEIGLIRNS